MLQRLVESGAFYLKDLKSIPIQEDNSILEEKSTGKKYVYIKAYEADISRFTKNANGRIYTKKLWEKVINEQKNVWDGSLGLADHPLDEEEGSVKNVFGVWRNLRIDEKNQTVKADLYLVGNYGRLAQDILEAGGKIGFSSSGYGELSEDNSGIVREDSYILERVSDWVLHPSQDVWAVRENALEDDNNVLEAKQESTKPLQESSMKINDSGKMSSRELRKFKEDILGWMTKVESITDLQEKLSELEEILSYFSEGVAPELKAEIEKQIESTKTQISTAIKEHGKIQETFAVKTADELKEGIKRVAADTQLYERDITEWKQIAAGLQERIKRQQAALASRPTVEAYRNMVEHYKLMERQFKKRERELLTLIENSEKTIESKNQKIEELLKKYKETISLLKERNSSNAIFKEGSLALLKKVNNFEYQEIEEKKLQEQKAQDEMRIDISPKRKASTIYEKFNESKEINEYFDDLVKRHGERILPFEDKIKSAKSLKEAMLQYTKVLSGMGGLSTKKVSEALDVEDRKKLIENQTGRRIREQSNFEKRLPQGWD